jgi:hypothetical protein
VRYTALYRAILLYTSLVQSVIVLYFFLSLFKSRSDSFGAQGPVICSSQAFVQISDSHIKTEWEILVGGTANSRSFYSCGPRKNRGTTRFQSLTAALQALPLPSLPIAPLSLKGRANPTFYCSLKGLPILLVKLGEHSTRTY